LYNNSEYLNILYTNADGLLNKRHELQILLNSLNKRPHVIAVNEIKPKNMPQQVQLSEFNLDGYNVFSQGLDDPTTRGLIIYVAADINATVVEIPSTFRESLFLNVKRSPNSLIHNDERLYDLIDYIEFSYKIPKIIVGDFNFSNISWYHIQHFGACAKCSGLSDNELTFVNILRKTLFFNM